MFFLKKTCLFLPLYFLCLTAPLHINTLSNSSSADWREQLSATLGSPFTPSYRKTFSDILRRQTSSADGLSSLAKTFASFPQQIQMQHSLKQSTLLTTNLECFSAYSFLLTSHSFHLADTFFSKPFHLNTVNVTLL